MNIELFSERDSNQDVYALKYYDAILQKEVAPAGVTINGVNTTTLEKNMAEIDWKVSFDFKAKKEWSVEDKASWEMELKIEAVIEDLNELEKSWEGKIIAVGLKLKYWAGASYQELIGSISPIKSKSEVTQRFYFFPGQAGITIDEAYRFLQNRWLEKQMQAKRKQAEDEKENVNKDNDHKSTGSGLLRKRHFRKSKVVKVNNSI